MDSRCVLTRENRGAFLAVYSPKCASPFRPMERRLFGRGMDRVKVAAPPQAKRTTLPSRLPKPTPPSGRVDLRQPFGLELYRKDKNAALASAPTFRSTAVESPPTQPRYGAHPDDTTPSRGRRTTTVGATIAPWQTCSGRIRQKPKNALRQPLLQLPPQLTSFQPGSTRASSRLPNPNDCATRHT